MYSTHKETQRCPRTSGRVRDWYFIAEQPAPAPHLAHPAGRAGRVIISFRAGDPVQMKRPSSLWRAHLCSERDRGPGKRRRWPPRSPRRAASAGIPVPYTLHPNCDEHGQAAEPECLIPIVMGAKQLVLGLSWPRKDMFRLRAKREQLLF